MEATAQDAYRLMLRRFIAPALRELGFRRGPSLGAFRYETASHAAEVRFRKSRGSTRRDVDFWINMHASDIKTEFVYWDWDLRSLAPELLSLWVLRAGDRVEPVASEVLRVFRGYGWPAIQAALDNPGYPRDPTVRWPRTFPKIPRGPRFDDEMEAENRSRAELEEIVGRADNDPRAFEALLARLETDPDPGIRQGPPGGCSAEPTKNAAARRCGPPPPKTRTSKSAGSPDTLSGSPNRKRRVRHPQLRPLRPLTIERQSHESDDRCGDHLGTKRQAIG